MNAKKHGISVVSARAQYEKQMPSKSPCLTRRRLQGVEAENLQGHR